MIRILAALICLAATPALADPPVIEKVVATKVGMGWRFDVTISHPDTGWDHFADGWDVVDGEGNVLGFRQLMHPHVNEQPFTRSLSGVIVPDGMREVYVRARCSVDGWSSEKIAVKLELGG